MTTTSQWTRTDSGRAWGGMVGRQDRAGDGARRANRTRGDSTSPDRGDVWRISDLATFGRKSGTVPADIVERLRDHARERESDTENVAPNDSDWRDGSPRANLDRGEWADQKWHTVTLPNTEGLRCEHRRAVGTCPTCNAVGARKRREGE